MKRLSIAVLLLSPFALVFGQDADQVLLRIGGREVLRSEFEYAYTKNRADSLLPPEAFLQTFIDLKLSALEAESKGLDTLPAFRQQLNVRVVEDGRRGQPLMTKTDAHKTACVRIAHLYIHLPQSSSRAFIQEACDKMEDIYRKASADGQFERMVMEAKNHPIDGIYGELTILPAHHTMEVIEQKIRSLEVGELSRPFVSPAGVHLIQLLGRDVHHEHAEDATAQDTQEEKRTLFLRAEIRDALLREALEQDETLQAEEEDLPGLLKDYFKSHRENYSWELPHYRGAVVVCRNKATAKRVKKLLKSAPQNQWDSLLKSLADREKGSIRLPYACGLYRIGTDSLVDRVVFKQETCQLPEDDTVVVKRGKVLKKRPKSYEDVYSQVYADYSAHRRELWKERLRKKYKVEINEEELKTVNIHQGNG